MAVADADLGQLRDAEEKRDHLALIEGLRDLVEADRRTLADPWVKEWCGRRWRDLFTRAAAEDEAAVRAASERLALPGTDLSIRTGRDRRPERQRIAERFLKDPPAGEWAEELPPAQIQDRLEATLVFCPGLINSMLPMRAFQVAFPAIAARRGWRVIAADAHPMRGCEANMADYVVAIERGEGLDHDCKPIAAGAGEPPGDVFLVGYSKGMADALTLLVHRPELAGKVKAIYSWGGAVGGSYLADSIYDAVKDLSLPLGGLGEALKAILKTVFPLVQLDGISERLDEYDVKTAIRDLTTTERDAFIAAHGATIDALDVPIFNITAATTAFEVPFFQVQGYLDIRRMGGDPDNDMQLTQDQARMKTPMATDLGVLHAHHWDISYDPFPVRTRLGSPNLDHRFPREAAITAIFELTAELGLIH
jgi:hypothetical protein